MSSLSVIKCSSPHPSIKSRSSEHHHQQKQQQHLSPSPSSIRQQANYRQRSNASGSGYNSDDVDDDDSADEMDDHIANGHHIIQSRPVSSGDSDSDTMDYLKITVPSDCRLKQTITPTNSPQSQSIQHSPHHAISVLSSILAKYETTNSGGTVLLERRRQPSPSPPMTVSCDNETDEPVIWSRQVNSERTSPRIRTSSTPPAPRHHNHHNNSRSAIHASSNCCNCCSSSSASSNSPRSQHQHHQQSQSNRHHVTTAMLMSSTSPAAASLKTRTLSLPQCSFTPTTGNSTGSGMDTAFCCNSHCTYIQVQSKKKFTKPEKSTAAVDMCNCPYRLTANSDVLETTC